MTDNMTNIDKKLRDMYKDKKTVNTESFYNDSEKILQNLSMLALANKVFVNMSIA